MSNPYISEPIQIVNTDYSSAVNPPVFSTQPQKRRKQKPKPHYLDNKGLTQLKHQLIKLHRGLNPDSDHCSMRCSTSALDHYIDDIRHDLLEADIYDNGIAKFLGLKLCKSPNACPKCSQIVGMARGILIGRWAEDEQRPPSL